MFRGIKLSGVIIASLVGTASAWAGPAYYYCRHYQGLPFSNLVISVTGKQVTLQPYTALESPGMRIYHGKIKKVYPSGNILVDFDSYSRQHFLEPYPHLLFTPSIFSNGRSGYVRVYNGGSNTARDTILSCETKRIFF